MGQVVSLVRHAVPNAPPSNAPAPHPESSRGNDDALWGDWMLRAQDGDRDAYRALLQAIAPYLRSIVSRYLTREDAEDAVQDVLLIVHDIRHTFEDGRPFKPWLATIARRRCIDLLRRRSYRLRHEFDTNEQDEHWASETASPDETVAQLQTARTLHQAVEALPERQREAVRLLRLQELSPAEAAARSGQNAGAIKVACHRAIKTLQRAIAPSEPSK